MSNYPPGAEAEMIRRERLESIEEANYELVLNNYLEESRSCLINQTLMHDDTDPAQDVVDYFDHDDMEKIIRAIVLADAEQITLKQLHDSISGIVRRSIEKAATAHADMKRDNGYTIYNM